VPLTVGPKTFILGGSNLADLFGGSLSDVSVGDIVAGGLIAPAGDTLAQVEALPLAVLLDLPAGASSSSATSQSKRAAALSKTVALVESGKHKSHKKSHRTHKHSHSIKG
jgi:hypothetical protein